jgi:hypothetical protein
LTRRPTNVHAQYTPALPPQAADAQLALLAHKKTLAEDAEVRVNGPAVVFASYAGAFLVLNLALAAVGGPPGHLAPAACAFVFNLWTLLALVL